MKVLLFFMLAEFMHIQVSINDMNCLSCTESMVKAFEKIRGVKNVAISIPEGKVTLDLADQNRVTLEQVWDVVKRIGFTPADTKVTVRGAVKGDKLNVSGIDKTIVIEGHASEGENIELKGTISPPADPRAPIKLRVN